MTYGLKALSSNSTVQIDTDNANKVIYQLAASGTITVPSRASMGLGYNSLNYVSNTITGVSAINPDYSLVFVKPSTAPTGSNTQSTFGETGSGSFTLYSSLESTSYSYYVYNPTSSGTTNIIPAPTGYGLVVYAADGTTVRFSSDSIALRVQGVITDNGSVSGTGLIALQQRKYTAIKPAALSPAKYFAKVTTFGASSVTQGEDIWFIGTTGTGASEEVEFNYLTATIRTIVAAV